MDGQDRSALDTLLLMGRHAKSPPIKLLGKHAVAAEVGRTDLGARVVLAIVPADFGTAKVKRVDELVRECIVHLRLRLHVVLAQYHSLY